MMITAHCVNPVSLAAGPPDEPQSCHCHNLTETEVTLQCVPGYDGGTLVTYEVESDLHVGSVYTSSMLGSVAMTGVPTKVVIRVDDLWPGSDYELHIYATNTHGRSSNHYSFHVTTMGGE